MKKHCELVRKHGKLKKLEDMEIELNLSEFENLPEILEENSDSKDWIRVCGPNCTRDIFYSCNIPRGIPLIACTTFNLI